MAVEETVIVKMVMAMMDGDKDSDDGNTGDNNYSLVGNVACECDGGCKGGVEDVVSCNGSTGSEDGRGDGDGELPDRSESWRVVSSSASLSSSTSQCCCIALHIPLTGGLLEGVGGERAGGRVGMKEEGRLVKVKLQLLLRQLQAGRSYGGIWQWKQFRLGMRMGGGKKCIFLEV
jgi:hypothetical protein